MKNKSLFGAVLLGLATLLPACKEKYDPMDSISALADQNIPGSYSYVTVDTANMQTMLYMYSLNKDGSGSYTIANCGNNIPEVIPTETPLTWTKGNYVDNNSWIEIFLNYADSARTVKWGSMVLSMDSFYYKYGAYVNNATVVYNKFPNTEWYRGDTTFFPKKDTVPTSYIAWVKVNGDAAYLSDDEIQAKKAFYAQEDVRESIKWYNETYKPVPLVVDSIKVGTKKKKLDGVMKTFCTFWDSTTVTKKEIVKSIKTLGVSSFHFDRVAGVNTGYYYYEFTSQDSSRYVVPTNINAYDSIYTYAIQSWCISKPSGKVDFDLLARGTLNIDVTRTTNGVKTVLKDSTLTDVIMPFSITRFYKTGVYADDEVTLNGRRHKPNK